MSKPSCGFDDNFWPCDDMRRITASDWEHAPISTVLRMIRNTRMSQHRPGRCTRRDDKVPWRWKEERTRYLCDCPQFLCDQHMLQHNSHGELCNTTQRRDCD